MNAEFEPDVRFAFGELFGKRLADPWHKTSNREPPNHVFFCANILEKKIHGSARYVKNCSIEPTGLIERQELQPGKERRAIKSFNFLREYMNPGISYAWNMQDAQAVDYNLFFQTEDLVPVFQYHRLITRKAIIVPLIQYHTFPGWNIPRLEDDFPFSQKAPRIFWRGNMAGTNLEDNRPIPIQHYFHSFSKQPNFFELIRRFSRIRVVSDLIDEKCADVGFSSTPEIASMNRELLLSTFPWSKKLFKDPVRPADQLQNKYILALDGFDGPSSMYWIYNSNSVVFRQSSPWQMFGDNEFLPWKTYVPIEPTGADVMEKFSWCEANLEKCEEIIHNARRAWRRIFEPKRYTDRLRAIFDAYQQAILD